MKKDGTSTGLGEAKQLRFFSAGGEEVSAKVKRAGEELKEGKTFDPMGAFEIVPDQNDLEDLWMIVDWAGGS